MSVSIDDIRNAIVNNLSAITGCQKVAYRSGNPTPPAIVVAGFGESMERVSFKAWTFELLVQGLAGKTLNTAAERRLDQWLLPGGATDVWAALESDKTLGGKVSNCIVTSNDGTQVITLDNGTEVLGTTWHLQIITL